MELRNIDIDGVLAAIKKASVEYVHQGCQLHTWFARSGYPSAVGPAQ